MRMCSRLLQLIRIAPIKSADISKAVLVTCLFWLALPILGEVGAADWHAHEFTCGSCHLAQDVNVDNADQLVAGEAALCRDCHQNAVTASHPVGIKPTAALPAEFPLNAQGELACSTCHQVHDPAPGKLRTDREGQEFCEACHHQSFFSAMKDGGISLMSFGHLDAGAPLAGDIDNFSIQCMSCHEKSADPRHRQAAGVASGPVSAVFNHPIGSRYVDSIDFGGYRPATRLPNAIVLPDGKLSCVSCHVGYSNRHGALVTENRADRLCRSCHLL